MTFPRYPAYKDSGVEWLGAIPSHWHPAPVKRLFAIVGGSTPASDDPTFWDGEIPWATPADLGNGTSLRLERTLRTITPSGLASCSTAMVPRGSIVLSTRAPIGSIAIASMPVCTNQGCKSLVPRGISDARYFAYLLSIATAALNVRGRGATFLELSGEELGRFQLPSPSVDEQQAIADFLDRETAKIDALVAEQERLIELLQAKRQAVISHAVTKGLDAGVPMKDSAVQWIGQMPSHWETVALRTVANVVRGASPRPAGDPRYFDGDSVPWVTVAEITKDEALYLTATESWLTAEGAAHSNQFPAGTVIYSNSGATLGVPKILAIDACANDG